MSGSERELGDDRPRRRSLTCMTTGALAGSAFGTVAAILAPLGWGVLLVAGTVLGGLVGRSAAPRISVEDWDPRANPHAYVGTRAPDDDITGA